MVLDGLARMDQQHPTSQSDEHRIWGLNAINIGCQHAM